MLQCLLPLVQRAVFKDARVRNAIDAAGRWFLTSGIQSPSGGVARFCDLAGSGNRGVSNEITGYTASACALLYELTGERVYLNAALRTARFLTRVAWREDLQTFPFENTAPVSPAYAFDCGIIIRGLNAVHRITGDGECVRVAYQAAKTMARDFVTPRAMHPVIALPSRQPLEYLPRWSREPGCFLLKAALAGKAFQLDAFETVLDQALENWRGFLGDTSDPGVMDRLHAFSYFLEALLFVQDRPGIRGVIAEGLAMAGAARDTMAPRFARSDVYAQMLRVRLWCGLPVDPEVAAREFETVLSYRDFRSDPRAEGGFCFGRRNGEPMPYANPVSTAFCLQAVALYAAWQQGDKLPSFDRLI